MLVQPAVAPVRGRSERAVGRAAAMVMNRLCRVDGRVIVRVVMLMLMAVIVPMVVVAV
jgi:hypothetical protein